MSRNAIFFLLRVGCPRVRRFVLRGADLSIIYYIYISYTSIYISHTSIWYTRRTVYDNESKRQESVAPLPSAAGYAPWARSGAGGATADFRLFGEVPGRGECPAPAPFTRSKRQIPRAKRPVRPAEGFHCLATATPPCRRVHQAACCIAAQRCESASTPFAHLPGLTLT